MWILNLKVIQSALPSCQCTVLCHLLSQHTVPFCGIVRQEESLAVTPSDVTSSLQVTEIHGASPLCVVYVACPQPAVYSTSSRCLGSEQGHTFVRLVQWSCCSWDPEWCRVHLCAEVRGCVGCRTNTWCHASCTHARTNTHTQSSKDASRSIASQVLSVRSLLSVWQTAVRI